MDTKHSAFLQPSLRWALKKEQRQWLPHNLKYVGKIRYRILHPFFFSHFLDAKATMCWLSEKRLTKCWLWDCFLLWVTFSTGKKLFTFFFQQKSSLRSFVKKSLKMFSYLKTSTFWSFWKKVRNECVLKKKIEMHLTMLKKSFLKTRGIPFWYPYDTREHHHSLLNVK